MLTFDFLLLLLVVYGLARMLRPKAPQDSTHGIRRSQPPPPDNRHTPPQPPALGNAPIVDATFEELE